ncbi:hypothetical protein [Propionivibrio soli]|uniref:hypothetical protein n=1 Tax=Propionivibrio soli TaxID=2976531 RepID=UPI0021E9A17E|nr:hypothetical protein [Propionivibrio soli]
MITLKEIAEVARVSRGTVEPVRQLVDYLMHGELPEEPIQYTRAEILIRQSLSNLTQTP